MRVVTIRQSTVRVKKLEKGFSCIIRIQNDEVKDKSQSDTGYSEEQNGTAAEFERNPFEDKTGSDLDLNVVNSPADNPAGRTPAALRLRRGGMAAPIVRSLARAALMRGSAVRAISTTPNCFSSKADDIMEKWPAEKLYH
ncbi:unnamed protein product [Strongylus vulgaris]|uniref:Uncharacterized protein n=1 Tax=Strongylus vulgaris TaxID=40348 RepID=A0A3P7LDW1_STRVU|nr:unnamed protein product [Strongylus vulgaris]